MTMVSPSHVQLVALAAYDAGLSVVPPREDGSKAPLGAWEKYKSNRPSSKQIQNWYGPRMGVGLICGAVSGNLELFEFDDIETYRDYRAAADSAGMGPLVDTIESGYLEETPGDGIHWLYKCEEIAGNTKLARRPKLAEEMGHSRDNIKVLIETRGEGGFVIIAPSNGKVHPTGSPYKLTKGGVESIPTITPDQRESLWELARSFDAMPKQGAPESSTQQHPSGDRPGDDFNARSNWNVVLAPHGWSLVFMRGNVGYWRRPGKADGISATTDFEDSGLLFVFSTSTEFESEKGYSKFSAYSQLNHNGNHSDAAKALAADGYGGGRNSKTNTNGEGVVLPDPKSFSDLGNAERLVALHNGLIRYCAEWGKWLVWDGRRWAPDVDGAIIRSAIATIKSMYARAAKLSEAASQTDDQATRDTYNAASAGLTAWGRKSESRSKIEAMAKLAESLPGVPVTTGALDVSPWALNFLNGTLDLHTGKLGPHVRQDLLTILLPYEFQPAEVLPLWDRFLSEAIPDSDTRSYIQRCVGATLVRRADDDVLLVCHGVGGTGKGTFLNAVLRSMGDYACAAELGTFTTARDAHSPQPDVARLKGKRMVAVSEVEANYGGTLTLLKKASGGDPISTRTHHGETFEFIPQFTLWIICNDRPRVPDNDTGIWRRIKEIPFGVKFGNPDTRIRPTLINPQVAGPAIMAWAVRGCLDYQEHGLGDLPREIREATDSYREDMNPLAEWLEESCLEMADLWTSFKELFRSYQTWTKDYHVRDPLGSKTFSKRLSERFTYRKAGDRGYMGIGLLTGSQARVDTSEVSVTPSTVGFPLSNSSHGEQLEIKCPKCPPEAQSTPDSKCPHSHGEVSEEVSGICQCESPEHYDQGETTPGKCPNCHGNLWCKGCDGCLGCKVRMTW